MEQTYFQRKTKGGRVYYVPAFMDWKSDPAEGIWYIKKESSNISFRWLSRKLEDLPEARKLAELEPYRDEICKVISENSRASPNEVATKIFEVLKNEGS